MYIVPVLERYAQCYTLYMYIYTVKIYNFLILTISEEIGLIAIKAINSWMVNALTFYVEAASENEKAGYKKKFAYVHKRLI